MGEPAGEGRQPKRDPAPAGFRAPAFPDRETLLREREELLEMVAQQQRLAQAGLAVAGLAHDASNHVQIMYGATAMASESGSLEQMEEALQVVQDQCTALTETMRAFLAFVRRRDGDDVASFRIADAFDQIHRVTRPVARDSEVELSFLVDENVEVRGASRLVVQAVVNLVNNAIRACAETHGTVAVTASRPAGLFCRIEVTDNGPGIPEDIRGNLFRPFVSGAGKDGNGIGLFIVRQAVRELNGSIRVRSSPEGSTFLVDLPAAL